MKIWDWLLFMIIGPWINSLLVVEARFPRDIFEDTGGGEMKENKPRDWFRLKLILYVIAFLTCVVGVIYTGYAGKHGWLSVCIIVGVGVSVSYFCQLFWSAHKRDQAEQAKKAEVDKGEESGKKGQ